MEPSNLGKETTLENGAIDKPTKGMEANISKKPRKGLFLVTLGLVFVVLIIMIGFFLLRARPVPIVQNSTVPQNSNLDVNQMREDIVTIVKYIESQRRQDGFYNYVAHYDEQCTITGGVKKCPFEGQQMFQTTNAWTALAHYAAFKVTGDSAELDKSNRDLTKLMDWCAKDSSQCLWVLAQPAIIYQDTKDQKILTFLKKESEILVNSAPSDNLMLVGIEARELGIIGGITKDQAIIEKAKQRVAVASNMLSKQKDMYRNAKISFGTSSCWVALANTSLLSRNDIQSIANNRKFLDNGKIGDHLSELFNPIQIHPCIESYISLYEISGSIGDLTTAKLLLSKFREEFYDGPAQKLAYGEGATMLYPKSYNGTGGLKKFSDLTDTSYTAFLTYKILYEK